MHLQALTQTTHQYVIKFGNANFRHNISMWVSPVA